MPVILPNDEEAIWVNPTLDVKEKLLAVLKPYSSEEMEAYEVSTKVNSPQFNTPSNIQPL